MTLHAMNEMLPVWGGAITQRFHPSTKRDERGVAFTHGFCQRPNIAKQAHTIEDGLLRPGKLHVHSCKTFTSVKTVLNYEQIQW